MGSARSAGWINKPALFRFHLSENLVVLAAGIVLAVLLRISLLKFQSGDFVVFLHPWYDFIKQHGGFNALRYDFSNYTPFYLYLLALISYLPLNFSEILAVKLVSIVFDFVGAFFVYKIVRLRYRTGVIPGFACLAMLFAPTVFLNSALWGQVDMGYTAGLLATLFFIMSGREILALVAFGLAVAFKLQAIFFLPFLLILFLTGKISWKFFWLVPSIYLVTILPAWLIGRPLLDLLLIYDNQVEAYKLLSFNAPNFYQWLPNNLYPFFYPAGLIWTCAVVLMFAAAVYKSQKEITPAMMVQLALISVLIMPYFLPEMHERYFFAADVLTIIFAFYFPRYFFVPLVVGMTSFFSYFPFLFHRQVIPLPLLALVLTVTIVFLLWHLAMTLQPDKTAGRNPFPSSHS